MKCLISNIVKMLIIFVVGLVRGSPTIMGLETIGIQSPFHIAGGRLTRAGIPARYPC